MVWEDSLGWTKASCCVDGRHGFVVGVKESFSSHARAAFLVLETKKNNATLCCVVDMRLVVWKKGSGRQSLNMAIFVARTVLPMQQEKKA